MPTPHGFVERLAELSGSGVPFVCVTLVEAVGSTPQDAGSKMLVTSTGLETGTVGGGRVEHQAIEHARHMLSQPARQVSPTELVEWNLKRDVGMTCGGTVKLFFETYNHCDWRIVVFGAGHVASAVVACLGQLDCHVTCIDPRGVARPHPRECSVAKNPPRRAALNRRRIAGRCVCRVHDHGPRDRSADPRRDLPPEPRISFPGRDRQPGQACRVVEGTRRRGNCG